MAYRWVVLVVVVAFTGCVDAVPGADFYYAYDDRKLVCAFPIDDYLIAEDWDRLHDRLQVAADNDWVVNLYAHSPGVTIQMATLDKALQMIEDTGLAFTTYRDMGPNAPPHAAAAFAFDDDGVESWTAVRSMLDRHAAQVTFFVTRFDDFTHDQREQLHELEDDGHVIEAHSVMHLEAEVYAKDHGADAYYADEVAPSFAALKADGYTPTSFAYPYGSRTDATDAVILPHVKFLRT